ncbi:adaptor protein MecA [Lactobacillus sp. PV034]|uniref:adaptor protein MecA n=1 Tax=Lactobacillus sp. PV034 TaxID=2594495 RepID=UPI00223EE24E|nr:adaptor protein MecA [Lactobacillus sp. PV034]QNQ80746.1 adaptor protein MecA [Lactobacillus sp. PV034]
MQVHRINENTIQVNIDADELKERGITMLDLLGNKSQIQNFFYQILNEVDGDHSFAKDDPVTFQVMPSGSGLELLISKVGNNVSDQSDKGDAQLKQLLDGLGDLQKTGDKNAFRKTKIEEETPDLLQSQRRIYVLKGIEMVAGLADTLKVEGLASSLYTYLHQYYLDLAFLDDNYIEMKPEDAWVIANEFGNNISLKKFNKIKPKAKRLIEEDALGNLRQYFTKA